MPELPEVETIRRGISPSILKQKIVATIIRNHQLRHPIPKNLPKILRGQSIQTVNRRSKYLLLSTEKGTLIIHLGMSGNLQIKNPAHKLTKHEHVNLILANGSALCYTDPRRFGAILWTNQDPLKHQLLKNLGPEPFAKDLTASYLFNRAQTKKYSIKQFLMDNQVITGIGNIYASEILFAAKINPLKKVKILSLPNYQKLIKIIHKILKLAIKHRGTTIKDHKDSLGKAGAFQNQLKVYGRAGKPCINCKNKLTTIRIGQRSTVFCPHCQS